MRHWAVFITAARAPPKVLNRAFLLIHDFQYGEYPATYGWTLLTSKELPTTPPPATAVPLPDAASTSNEFASMSLEEINTFVREHEVLLTNVGISNSNWLVIDQTGLETSTCIVCEQVYNSGEENEGEGQEGYTSEFCACRMPYEEAWGMIVNLDIANMGFEDFVNEEDGVQADGTWKWRLFRPNTEESEAPSEEEVKREKALQALRETGDVD
ncbi:hypothetical protein B0H19DRAFT_1167582 [Mycena capillaripes]|nr:hypothetical protein B0H19DRAFT_1167582 [Mycena capillaripes]